MCIFCSIAVRRYYFHFMILNAWYMKIYSFMSIGRLISVSIPYIRRFLSCLLWFIIEFFHIPLASLALVLETINVRLEIYSDIFPTRDDLMLLAELDEKKHAHGQMVNIKVKSWDDENGFQISIYCNDYHAFWRENAPRYNRDRTVYYDFTVATQNLTTANWPQNESVHLYETSFWTPVAQ